MQLLRRSPRDEAEKQYLRAIDAEEVCRNGDWGYYRIPVERGAFAQYACCDSKLQYLRPVYRRYVVFGAAVYVALAMDMSAFLHLPMTPLHAVVLAALTLLALSFTVGVTRFHRVLKGLRRGAAEELGAVCREKKTESSEKKP